MHLEDLISELSFKAIRSSGSGGQHVNKVSSKIELTFDLENSKILSEDEKELLNEALKNRLTKENKLVLQCGESRSQHKNKEIVIKRFSDMILKGLTPKKKRISTKKPKKANKKRLDDKAKKSEKKGLRKKPKTD